MGFVEGLTYEQLSQLAGCTPAALRKRVSRYNISKTKALADCTGVSHDTLLVIKNYEELENLFVTKINMERRFTRNSFSPRHTAATKVENSAETTDVTESDTLIDTFLNNPAPINPELDKLSHRLEDKQSVTEESKVGQIKNSIEEWMVSNTGRVTTVLRSNFLSVTVMLLLSIVVATVFTSRVALAVGVTPFFAYSIAILVDVSAIIFMFRGKKWLSWVFGVNIFLQIALTSESTLASLWFSQETILGMKVALLATAVLTAIEGFSSLSSQNKD